MNFRASRIPGITMRTFALLSSFDQLNGFLKTFNVKMFYLIQYLGHCVNQDTEEGKVIKTYANNVVSYLQQCIFISGELRLVSDV